MFIVCPQCQTSLEIDPTLASGEIVCTACGSSFRLDLPALPTVSAANWRPGAGQRTLGRFELLELVGSGAFGSVFKARDPKLDRTVALKVPRQPGPVTPGDHDRLAREARSVAQLRHPNIVPVHEVGEHEGTPFLVSEYIDGVTLADRLTARRPTFVESARLVAALAAALDYAHRQGVVHRDIKPSNVLLDAAGVPRLTDFGLAKRDAGEVTVTTDGQVLGTPAYMSPEQARGEGHRVDGRSDVYSLGVILYQLLTGELPFRGNQRMLLHQVLNDDPRPPRALNDRVPRDLETVCVKAMAKEPARRYPTAGELAADLERWLNNQPVLARPPSAWYRGRKFAARHRAVVGGTAATLLALLLGVAGTAAALGKARAEARRANEALGEAEREKEAALEAEWRRKAELVRTHAVAARLAAQRGEWGRALEQYDAALAGGPEDEVGLWLGKLDARLALYQYREFRADLEALAARPDLGAHAGTVRLLQGYERLMRMGKGVADPLVPVREALRLELPPAERAYAQALLAPTVPEVVGHLQKAIEADPFHRRSHDLLPMFLFLTGRVAEAREATQRLRNVAPNSITADGYLVLFRAVEGDLDGAYRECAKARASLGEDGEEMFRLVARLFHTVGSEEFQWGQGLSQMAVLVEFVKATPRAVRLMGGSADEQRRANWAQFAVFRLPCLQDYGSDTVLSKIVSGNLLFLFQVTPADYAEAVGRLAKRIPNGFFFYQQGLLLHTAGRLPEAEAALRTALKTPSFVPVERRALFELLLVLMERARPLPEAARKPLHEEARKHLARLAAWGTYPAWALGWLALAANELKEHGLELELSEAWVRQAPQDANALRARLRAEFAVGAHERAVRTLEALLAKGDDRAGYLNQQGVAEYRRGDYRRALAKMLEVKALDPKHQYVEGNFRAIEGQLRRERAEAPLLLAKLRLRPALVRARSGDHAGAVAAAREAVPEKEPDGDTRVALACVHALALAAAAKDTKLAPEARQKEAARLAAEAVAELKAAHAAGYFKEPERVTFLASEKDLDAVRQVPEYKKLFPPPAPKK